MSDVGIVTLSGTNTYTGATTITTGTLKATAINGGCAGIIISKVKAYFNGGILKASDADALGTTGANTTINSGGTLDAFVSIAEPIVLN
jgi:autotransporter-associated beta strand protein